MEPRENDKVWSCGFACGAFVVCVIFFIATIQQSRSYHEVIMDQTKVEAYRAKQAAEAALERD